MHTYPLMLDVRYREIVIVGGGEVAVRKAQGVLAAGATRVRAVALDFDPKMPPEVARVTAAYSRHHLRGAELVFAATDDPAVNDAVVRDARAERALLCRADSDDEHPGDFATPAAIRRGPVVVSVSAGGSPALAAKLRDAVERVIDDRWVKLAEAMQSIRPKILAIPRIDIARRRDIFRTLASDQALAAVESGGVEGLKKWMIGKFPELAVVV